MFVFLFFQVSKSYQTKMLKNKETVQRVTKSFSRPDYMHRDYIVEPPSLSLTSHLDHHHPPASCSYLYGIFLPEINTSISRTGWSPNALMWYTKSFLLIISTNIWVRPVESAMNPKMNNKSALTITSTPNIVLFRLAMCTADNVTFHRHKHLGCSWRKPIPIWRLPVVSLMHSRQKCFQVPTSLCPKYPEVIRGPRSIWTLSNFRQEMILFFPPGNNVDTRCKSNEKFQTWGTKYRIRIEQWTENKAMWF